MAMRFFPALATASAIVFLPACDEDGLGTHGCPTSYSTDWGSHGLKLEHTEPQQCPVFLAEAGATRETGATVVDGGTAEFVEAFLNVKDFSGDPVANTLRAFREDTDGRWVAEIYVSYEAGQDNLGPDEARFTLTYPPDGSPGPQAIMRISYTDRLVANISGPGIVPLGSSKSFSAAIDTGESPFRYEWYRDWELVSTSATYSTTFNEEGEVYLRLDVIDARGEVDSSSKFVTVTSCTDGSKVC